VFALPGGSVRSIKDPAGAFLEAQPEKISHCHFDFTADGRQSSPCKLLAWKLPFKVWVLLKRDLPGGLRDAAKAIAGDRSGSVFDLPIIVLSGGR
jgi:hypothetical protein